MEKTFLPLTSDPDGSVFAEQVKQELLESSKAILSKYFLESAVHREYLNLLSKYYSGESLFAKAYNYLSKYQKNESLINDIIAFILYQTQIEIYSGKKRTLDMVTAHMHKKLNDNAGLMQINILEFIARIVDKSNQLVEIKIVYNYLPKMSKHDYIHVFCLTEYEKNLI